MKCENYAWIISSETLKRIKTKNLEKASLRNFRSFDVNIIINTVTSKKWADIDEDEAILN
jgi:hypothetical protein